MPRSRCCWPRWRCWPAIFRPGARPRSTPWWRCGTNDRAVPRPSLPRQMRHVAIVFVADEFEQFGVGQQVHGLDDRPGPGVGFRVVDRDGQVHVAEILAMEPLDDVQLVGGGLAELIQPGLSIETARVDNQGVAVPDRKST